MGFLISTPTDKERRSLQFGDRLKCIIGGVLQLTPKIQHFSREDYVRNAINSG
ncbi:hypothetical protein M595_2110 [Lyngbya aestuarii BL J]|uniref:Uncharacterized protein n=1 Tax=Lyngbya aestuarii BL J TaxID=1348334 RepID=U7QNG0_9CYAN|nr:hypothetical protein M595_2110 [Lyngbya aestuarii BL J]